MTVYHVTTKKKLDRYKATGCILPPVRAWERIEDAMRFSIQTGRRIILRINMTNPKRLPGHQGRAVFQNCMCMDAGW